MAQKRDLIGKARARRLDCLIFDVLFWREFGNYLTQCSNRKEKSRGENPGL
jgi:hypothetical protein